MRGIELIGLSVLCIAMGAMLAGAALGVMTAAQTNPRPVVVASLAAATPANDADDDDDAGAATTDAASQEANPENTGDGVMDDLDDGPPPTVPTARPVLRAEVGAAGTPAPNGVDTHPSPAAANARAAAVPSERRRSGVVNSDSVPEGPAVGYAHGRAMRIYVERLDSKPVERHTAAAYRRMRDAAQRDHIALRIVSGFRTMEHQQALYRAYRLGRGNLAATPGHSNHQSGHALDLNTSSPGVFRWLTRNGRRFGFRRTVPTEPWHWEWW
jgi:hypothetical protein